MIRALPFLFCLSASAALVPFYSDPSYQRDEPTSPPWFVSNNGQPSNLYLNGVWQSSESGTNDMGLYAAWAIHSGGVKVGVVGMTAHGLRVLDCVRTVSPNSEIVSIALLRLYPDTVAEGISNAVSVNCKVIVLTTGYGSPDPILYAAIRHAQTFGIVVVVSAPNVEGGIDYPGLWELRNVLTVSSTDRNGGHYNPSGFDASCVSAPGRNIVAAGTYSQGTSYACPLAAGCVAILMDAYPGQLPAWYINRLRSTADGSYNRLNLARALTP